MKIARSVGTPVAKVGPAARRPIQRNAAVCSEHQPQRLGLPCRLGCIASAHGWPAFLRLPQEARSRSNRSYQIRSENRD